jgi:protoheme IX farnesyltransferase
MLIAVGSFNVQLKLYLQLGKFRLCLLVLFTALIGYGLGVSQFNIVAFTSFLLGTLLCAMGANGLNQWWEKERDSKMVRTRNRPIPSRRMSSNHALMAASTWSVLGLLLLFVAVNHLTALLAFITLVSYLLIYTPIKPHSPIAVLFGAIPGAIPPMMGWSAATGTLSTEAWLLACVLFVWQVPHFMSLATIYKQDYDKGGYRLLPDNPEFDSATRSIIMVFSLALLSITTLAPAMGLGNNLFFTGALILGGVMLWLSIKLYKHYSVVNARLVFRASIFYIPILMILLLIDERVLSFF